MRIRILSVLLLIAIVLSGNVSPQAAVKYTSNIQRGVWVATVANIDFPSKPGLSEAEMKTELKDIVNKVAGAGLNTIYFQVRPAADSMYKPYQFPWSKWLTGEQGKAPENGFDPLKYIIRVANSKSIQVHAWMNPYRITTGSESKPEHNLNVLAATHPARLHPEWVVKHKDGKMYFNPGEPEVINLVVEEAKYLMKNYNLAGVHFDDYFYPDKNFSDKATFKKYGGDFSNINDWRRSNVTKLVTKVRRGMKKIKPYAVFGVSPFAVWANKSTNNLGSDTNAGVESYYDHFADTRMWVLKNKIDYIVPQIYWHIGFEIADYSKILKWWVNVSKNSKVKLYIGHAAYRLGEDPNWSSIKTLTKQLDLNKKYPQVKGSVFYGYEKLSEDKYGISGKLKAWRDGSGAFVKFKITRPTKKITTNTSSYTIKGKADPRYAVKLGQTLIFPTFKGNFTKKTDLKKGLNVVEFKHRGKSLKVPISRK